MHRQSWSLAILLGILLTVSGCGAATGNKEVKTVQTGLRDTTITMEERPTPTPMSLTPKKQEAPTPTVAAEPTATPAVSSGTNTGSQTTTVAAAKTGAAPYGQPPAMTEQEKTLTQQLFALINSDRASRGLSAFTWNATLAGGARLHSWNMYHCGFSHTCPDGRTQCQRIEAEGFAGLECAENIAYAGPYPTPYQGMRNIQEGMVNEPPTGWHRIHLLSTTLHAVGAGVYVDPSGYIWFTEDFVS